MNTDTGIYMISSPSGNFYIGSAASFKKRWDRHRHLLRNGLHHSRALQSAYDKYEGKLVFSVVVRCAIPDLLAIEQRYIDRLKPRYNVRQIAGSGLGLKHTEEFKAKMSARHKGDKNHNFGKTIPPEVRAKISESLRGAKNLNFGKPLTSEAQERLLAGIRKAVICGETGAIFESGKAAVDWLRDNGHPTARTSHISSACHGKLARAYGYAWRFA